MFYLDRLVNSHERINNYYKEHKIYSALHNVTAQDNDKLSFVTNKVNNNNTKKHKGKQNTHI